VRKTAAGSEAVWIPSSSRGAGKQALRRERPRGGMLA
jgi:hypothetical protein